MSNYIELSPQIMAHESWITDSTEVNATLEWLDDHPDQAPGRTITQSDYQRLMDDTSMPYGVGFTDGFHQAGGFIIPDPEPTNVEKLSDDLAKWTGDIETCVGLGLASWLADKGWEKAPGGDDE